MKTHLRIRAVSIIIAAALAVPLALRPDSYLEGASAPSFGFGTMRMHGAEARGSRPLLAILLEYSDVRFRHPVGYYEAMIFGPRTPVSMFTPNIAGYFRENSGGKFTWSRAGVLGPFQHPDDPATRGYDESLMQCATVRAGCPAAAGRNWMTLLSKAVELAATQGRFDFARFDANGDGRVTEQELAILVINAEPPPSPAGNNSIQGNRFGFPEPGGCVRPGGSRVSVCGSVVLMGEAVGLATMAHELTHLLNGEDAYGSRYRNNGRMTLMAGTEFAPEDDRTIFHLDPWHKIRLGWVKPRVAAIQPGAPGRSATLTVPQGSGYEPVVFYDPARGANEFVILEFRNPAVGAHDRDAADAGVALWYLQTTSRDDLNSMPSEILWGPDRVLQSRPAPGSDDTRSAAGDAIGAGPDLILQSTPARGSKETQDTLERDGTIWLYGSPDHARGVSTLWREEHREVTVRWPNSGGRLDSGLRFRVGPMSRTAQTVDIEWSFGGRPFIARIDEARVSSRTVRAGNLIPLDGTFGVRGASRIVSFTKGTRFYDLPIESWTQSRITVKVPEGVPPDVYGLCIYNDREHRVGGCAPFFFTVTR